MQSTAILDNLNAGSQAIERRVGPSRLLSRLYRDIGLAAVVDELDLDLEDLEPDVGEAIGRGARYLTPRPIKAA